jgi:hypothetical protein
MTFEKQVIDLHFRQLSQYDRQRRCREYQKIATFIEELENSEEQNGGYEYMDERDRWKDT